MENYNSKSKVELEIFAIIQHKVERVPHFTHDTEIYNTFISAVNRVIISVFWCHNSNSTAYELHSASGNYTTKYVLCESGEFLFTSFLLKQIVYYQNIIRITSE